MMPGQYLVGGVLAATFVLFVVGCPFPFVSGCQFLTSPSPPGSLFFTGAIQDKGDSDTQGCGDGVENEPLQGREAFGGDGILARTWADPSAFWTAFGVLVGIGGLLSIGLQLKETRNATRQTQRSVDAFIAAERGRPLVHSMVEKPDGMGGTDLHFVIENVGRGWCALTGDWFDVTYLTDPARIPGIPRDQELTSAYQPISPGMKVNTGTEFGVESRRPIKLPCPPKGATHFAVRAILGYETAFGEKRLAGFTWCAAIDETRIVRLPTMHYTFDVPTGFDPGTRP